MKFMKVTVSLRNNQEMMDDVMDAEPGDLKVGWLALHKSLRPLLINPDHILYVKEVRALVENPSPRHGREPYESVAASILTMTNGSEIMVNEPLMNLSKIIASL
jgi:hypothetical protein